MSVRGFTLLELLVAMAVSLLLAGLLLTATTNLLQSGRRAQGGATLAIEAKLVLDQLERDLQGAILHAPDTNLLDPNLLDARLVDAGDLAGHGWELPPSGIFKPGPESLRLLPAGRAGAPADIADARFSQSGLWLRLITSDYDSVLGATVPSAVSYQLGRRRTAAADSAPVRYALLREKLSAADTLAVLASPPFTASAPAALTAPDNSDVIATNVIDFGVWLFSRDEYGTETRVFPQSDTSAGASGGTRRTVAWVMIRVLTQEGAALIDALESGRAAVPPGRRTGEWWWEQAEAHSRVFVRRIELKGAPW